MNCRIGKFVVFVFSFFFLSTLSAQPAGQEIKWFRVGSLHSWFSNLGSELESGRTGNDAQQQDGLRWPADYEFQDCIAAKSMFIGTTNYDDPVYGVSFPYKVVAVGTRGADAMSEIMPHNFKMYGKFDHPLVFVDGDPATNNYFDDLVDVVDPNLDSDRKIVNQLHSSIGISIDRTLRAFSQQYNDNYFVYEYVFKNTGIIDLNGTKVEKTLTDVIFHFQYRYAIGHEAFRKGWAAVNNINWGRNIINEVVGPHLPNDQSGSELRAHYSWYGPHSQSAGGCSGDWGCPNYSRGGPLGASQYVGTVVLHADTSPQNQSNDMLQPKTSKYLGNDTDNTTMSQYDKNAMEKYYLRINAGHPEKTHAQEVGDGCADSWGSDAGGFAQAQGFGPYTLEPGDSIRIVIAEAVNGISRKKSLEVGNNWFSHSGSSSLNLPGGGTTTDNTEYLKAWFETGSDSLFETFRRASVNYNNNYDHPLPPEPPSLFEIKSGGDRIMLSWDGTAPESHPYFDGYQIYRAVSRPDTTYELIYETDGSTPVSSYEDRTPVRGFDYYYYIVSKDNGSTNPLNPGIPLVSNRFYTMTNKPAYLRRPAGGELSEIRIVPNPYHINAVKLQFGIDAPDRLAFYGLPPECTIRIYTERGDLIDTIEHIDGSGDELWNSITSSRQVIVSGIYIAVFETPNGESAIRKFIVVR